MIEQNVAEEATVLSHLCKSNTFAIVAPHLDDAVIIRTVGATQVKLAVLAATTITELYINGYLKQFSKGKVIRYRITEAGKVHALTVYAAAGYLDRNEERTENSDKLIGVSPRTFRHGRYASESPIVQMYSLQRRRLHFRQWISEQGFEAATRLAADFIQARVSKNWQPSINWDLIGVQICEEYKSNSIPKVWYSQEVTDPFECALKAVGADLSDILLLFVCYEHGIALTEKALELPARSGKAVLGAALNRLVDHYALATDETYAYIGKAYTK